MNTNKNDRENAKRLFLEGKTLEEIAHVLGVKSATVRKWKQRDKWPPRVTKKASRPKVAVTKSAAPHEEPSIPGAMTYRQQIFSEIYAEIFNATVAYMKAYNASRESARTAGPRLLQNDAVRAYVKYLKEIKSQQIMADIGDLVELYMQIAFADYTDYAEFGTEDRPIVDKSGVPVMIVGQSGAPSILTHKVNVVKLKSSAEVDGRIVTEVKTSKDGTSVKLADKVAAMKWLGEYFMANPMDRHRVEYDQKRQQLERERFEHQKKQDEKGDW